MPGIGLIGKYVKSPHMLAYAMGEIHWESLDSEYQGKLFHFLREKPKNK